MSIYQANGSTNDFAPYNAGMNFDDVLETEKKDERPPSYNGATYNNGGVSSLPPAYNGAEKKSSNTAPKKNKWLEVLKHNLLLLMLIVAMGVGIGMGFGLRQYNFSDREISYFEFPGQLLLRMLKMVILPLVVSSLIAGMAALPAKAAGKLGGLTVLYYMITTLLAVILGIILVVIIQPGFRGKPSTHTARNTNVSPVDSLLDLIRNAFPNNLVTACFRQYRTQVIPVLKPMNVTYNFTYETTPNPSEPWPTEMVKSGEYKTSPGETDGMNVLGLVVFSIVFGIIIGRMGRSGRILLDFFQALHEAIVKMVMLIIWYSPLGIMFLLAARIMKMEDPATDFTQLGWYAMTVLVGLFGHGFVVLPLIYLALARKNPLKHLWHMAQALLTAFGTASSSATLPVTMRCLEDNAGVNKLVSKFVLPVGATINMDGTALYEAVASIFIAQINGRYLSFGEIVTVSVTATAAAIGAAGVPEAGLVTMLIVLTAVGLPTDGVEVIYAIDWFLDRCRTAINVWGDSVGAGVVEVMGRKSLKKFDAENEAGTHDNLAYSPDDD